MISAEIIAKVAESTNLSPELVKKIYEAYWEVIRQHIIALPLKEDLSDEEFLQLQPNINIPSIGKLYVTLDRYKRVKKHHAIFNDLKNKKNATHQEN